MKDKDWRFDWFWEVEAWLWWAGGTIEATIEAHGETKNEPEVEGVRKIETQQRELNI